MCSAVFCWDGSVYVCMLLQAVHCEPGLYNGAFLSAAAPEVIDGRPVSLATDIWSVGVLVYVM